MLMMINVTLTVQRCSL